jgi:hypothetical protein
LTHARRQRFRGTPFSQSTGLASAGHIDWDAGTDVTYSPTDLGISPDAGYAGGIWASDDQHVWIVAAQGVITHFDGSTWSRESSGTSADLNSVWGSSADDVWAVGAAGTLVHRAGAGWTPVMSPTSANLKAIWGSGDCDIWAVGDRGTVLRFH